MSDTIAAISTPAGAGGIGIVRTSGERSLEIMKKLMRGCPDEPEDRHAYYGRVIDSADGEIIDEAIFIYMKAPHTYTCEDVLEIQAHGSNASLRAVLRAVLRSGARMAEPGEFTKLAFLNGRIDLAEAEAVIDLIQARTEMPRRIAAGQLAGRLSLEVAEMREALTGLLAEMAVDIDFPDEDEVALTYEAYISGVNEVMARIDDALLTADAGRIARDGLKVAIVGKPNVGKSSLMNALIGESRVIVTNVPGTTRDTVEESISIGGMPLILVDTAGLRDSSDEVEAIGIEKSRGELTTADMILMVVDGSEDPDDEDRAAARTIRDSYEYGDAETARVISERVIVVANKADLGKRVNEADLAELLDVEHVTMITTSMLDSAGADPVKSEIADRIMAGHIATESGITITSERHKALLESAKVDLVDAVDLLKAREALEIAELDIHKAYDTLGEIIGETAGEEILDAVFSRFCLGK